MADETDAPDVKDVLIIKTPSGSTDPNALSQFQSETYTTALKNGKISRQHRAVILALRDMANLPATIAKLNQTISVGYVQAEVQAISTKLDAVIDALNTLSTALGGVKTTATTSVTKL